MGLADDLEKALLSQTSDYQEKSTVSSGISEDVTDSINSSISSSVKVEDRTRERKTSPFSSNKSIPVSKIIGCIVIVLVLPFLFYSVYTYVSKDKGPDFMQEVEDGDITAFYYTVEERDLLRVNGYTASDIERHEILETNPLELVRDAELARKAKYDEEIKPYLDGASEKYKSLERDTWLGGKSINNLILSNPESNELNTRTYNCDYKKIEPKGAQLFLKLYLEEFDQTLFMTVDPVRYKSLNDAGNIVVIIEYYDYVEKGIVVTDVREKNITE